MSIRIAIIEDEYFFRQALKKYISGFGKPYELAGEAGNGQDGLQLLRREQPDVALVDITMPLMNGIEMIQHAVEEGIRTQIVILTGYGEFGYARSAIQLGVKDYLLKPLSPDSLRQCLDKLAEGITRAKDEITLSQSSVRNIMRGQLAEQLTRNGQHTIDTELMFEHLNFPRKDSAYCVALLQSAPDAMQTLDLAIRQELDYSGNRAVWYTHDACSVCLVTALDQDVDPMPSLMGLLSAISRQMEQSGGALLVSVGAPCTGIGAIRTSYLQARTIQYYHLFRTDANIATYAPGMAAPPTAPLFGIKEQYQLAHVLKSGDTQSVHRFLGEQFERVELSQADANAVYMLIASMLSVILEFSPVQTGGNEGDAASLFPAIFAMQDISQLREFVVAQALEAMRRSEPDGGAHQSTIKRVNAYIEAHFSDPKLCLEDIARVHAISVQYLCMLYRKHMNMTIGDHLFDVRMDHALRLLEAGQSNISLVAEQCGYNDIGYFGKCFKKKFGLSPSQYLSAHVNW